jgi:hypothetical protein
MELSRIAIVLTAHPGQQKFWAPVLLSLEGFPGPLVLAYDDLDTACLPPDVTKRFAAIVVTGFAPGRLGHGPGELVCMRAGFAAARDQGAPCVLKICFDRPLWRWRHLDRLVARLESDAVDCLCCGTAICFGRTELLAEAMDQGDPAGRKGSAESFWWRALAQRKVRVAKIDDAFWWEKRLGALHIHGEYCLNHGHGPGWSWPAGQLWPRTEL